MESEKKCTRHLTAKASFNCDRCGESFCPECRCELLGGDVCCTECAVDSAGENSGEFGLYHGAGYPDVHRPMNKRRRGRFLAVVLLIGLPLFVAELVFLHHSTAVVAGPEVEARRVMSDTLVLVTELNRYKAEVGRYPERLDLIVPSHWDPRDTAELESYDYRRVGSTRFALRPRLTGDEKEDAGIVRALALIPRSLGEDGSLEVFLRAEQRKEQPLPPGGGV